MALTQVELTGIDGSTGSIPLASIDSIKNSASLSNNIVLNADGTTTLTPSNIIKSGTAVASTSGTFVDFTGIPTWVKRIMVMFNGVSTNGTSEFLVQIGTSSGVETTGYVSTSVNAINAAATAASSGTAGFILRFILASNTVSGHMVITLADSNTWISSHTAKGGTTFNVCGGGDKTLSGTLDRIRITTVNGTDTFDAGSVNILFEG